MNLLDIFRRKAVIIPEEIAKGQVTALGESIRLQRLAVEEGMDHNAAMQADADRRYKGYVESEKACAEHRAWAKAETEKQTALMTEIRDLLRKQ